MFFKAITIIAVTVAVFILAVKTPDLRGESDGIAIPLTIRSNPDAHKFHATSHNAKIIHGPSGMDGSERDDGTPHPSGVKRDGHGAGIDLKQYMDRVWYGTISIGIPGKFFTVQLNTGYSDLFIPSSAGDENCRSHYRAGQTWDFSSSQTTNVTINEDFAIQFADGRIVSGTQYADCVTIAGFTADLQTIGVATTYSLNMAASNFPPDGVLGLAFPSYSKFRDQSPLFHTLYQEGKLPQPVFSLKLTPFGGELYLGGTNQALYVQKTLVYTPVTNPASGLWELKIDNIQVNEVIVLTDVTAVIDSGSNFIFGDLQGVLAVHRAASGGPHEGGGGYYTFPCRSFPSVTFTIGGRPFVLPAKALNKGWVAFMSPHCFSGIATVEGGSTTTRFWSIGTVFLQQFYTVYDFNILSPRIGFAELS